MLFKMKSLEEFFRNRISFTTNKNHDPDKKRKTEYVSNVFKPEDSNIDLKKKNTILLLYV